MVTATDPSGEFDTITVTINVANVDEAPGVSGPTSLNYKENDIVAVGSYAAANPQNGTIVWGEVRRRQRRLFHQQHRGTHLQHPAKL